MKRPSDDDGQGSGSADSKAEEMARQFLQKYPRFFLYAGIGLAVLFVVVMLIAKLTKTSP